MQGVIVHTSINDLIYPLTDNYPLAIANIVNKPLVCYQVEYLLRYGINDIQICVEKRFAHKIEKYFRQHFKVPEEQRGKVNIDLVVFQEDLDTVIVLRQITQRVQADVVVIEGDSLVDVPLDEVMDTHFMSDSSITALLKEFDMSRGGRGAKKDEQSQDIFGISDVTPDVTSHIAAPRSQYNRIVMKTTAQDANYKDIKFKPSLLKK